ncbi:methyl-accepting chemotaxis protein [Cohaesibacter haloalkalitolerans]|uniref:methyl-accepting chemotaxis protein n=1 Tax=Cohaesibacter haloalkalitolerans TaxID=1162980 RepID=UPI000E64AB7E|nr:cache domain-containing protein [Cohaesibacter haloalkalitolerans]
MRFTIAKRLYLLVGIFFIGLSCLSFTMDRSFRSELSDQKAEELKSLVDAAVNVAQSKYDAFKSGEMSEDEAKLAAAKAIQFMRYRGSEYFWINDMNSVIVMHAAKPELNGKNLSDLKDANGVNIFPAFVKAVKTGGAGFVGYMWPKAGSENAVDKLSYVKAFAPWGWVVGTGVYIDDLQAILWSNTRMMLLIGSIVLIISLLAAWLTIRSIIHPVHALKETMLRLASDHAVDVIPAEGRSDELGEMAGSVKIFRDMREERKVLAAQQEKDQAARAERQIQIDRLIEAFRSEATGELSVVSEQMQRLQATAGNLSTLSNRTAERSGKAQGAASLASSNVQTVAAASEEFSASIGEIARQVDQATSAVNTAMITTGAANDRVGSLAAAAQQIGDVVSLIQDIAEQTNLLALNATIEAARAGEMGKGFAVVASEVKELANQTSKATEQISAQINAIQSETQEAVQSIEEIGTTIEQVNGFTASISEAVQQQSLATNEIANSIQEAARGTTALSQDIGVVSDAVGETHKAVDEVSAVSIDVNRCASGLANTVDQFLIKVSSA